MKSLGKILLATILFLVLSISLLGQPQQSTSMSQLATQASAAYDAKNWAEAGKLYSQIVQSAPNPRAWYRLGVSFSKSGENEKAIEAFEKSSAMGLPNYAEYGLAVVFASMRNKEKAFEHLNKAAENGFNQVDQMATDPDLSDLKSDPRFAKILEVVTRNQEPCAYAPENRQFDFWLGEWSVVTTQGETSAGDSRIELILGDCVVQENWTSSGNVGYSGKSYNIYNTAKALGAILGGQHRGKHLLLRRTAGWSDGLLDRRNSAAGWKEAEATSAIHQARVRQGAAIQPRV